MRPIQTRIFLSEIQICLQVTANRDAEEDDDVKVKGIEDHDVSMTEEEKAPHQMDENPQEAGAEEDEDDSDSKFNEDLLCEHG